MGDELDGGGDVVLPSRCSFAESSSTDGGAGELAEDDLLALKRMVNATFAGSGVFLCITSFDVDDRLFCELESEGG